MASCAPPDTGAVGTLRRALGGLDSQQALELLIAKTRDTASNPEFLSQIPSALTQPRAA